MNGLTNFFAFSTGGFACFAALWIARALQTRRSRRRHEAYTHELHARETLYAEFVNTCAKLLRDFLEDGIVDPATLTCVVATINRIRLTASTPVLKAAETTLQTITHNYLENEFLTIDEKTTQLRETALNGDDPVSEFSRACRDELWELLPSCG